MEIEKKEAGVLPDADGKIVCTRCGKRLADRNFYVYRNGKKCEICKPCLTAHIDMPDALRDTRYYTPQENKSEQAAKAYWEKIKGTRE